MKNRVIKFRVFIAGIMYESFNPFDKEFMNSGGSFHPDAVFMQYTGLVDKTGKEIFEGDIIRRNTGYTFVEKFGTYSVGDTSVRGYNFHEEDEVIGNIFENPELLKS